jgi:hypothetical protein
MGSKQIFFTQILKRVIERGRAKDTALTETRGYGCALAAPGPEPKPGFRLQGSPPLN